MEEPKHWLFHAFPSCLEKELLHLLSDSSVFSIDPSIWNSYDVMYQHETLCIPWRLYNKFSSVDCRLQPTTLYQTIQFCIYTRHHDGYIRQECLRHVLKFSNDYPWIIPYVIHLCGEYVINILFDIEKDLKQINQPLLREFISENQAYYQRVKSRVISYWDCYYRDSYPDLNEYVGKRILRYLDTLPE